LVITSDDQPRDKPSDLRQYMPHTARLMREGVRYPNAAVGYPLCCPSRATAMTGRYAHNTGVVDIHSGWKLDPTSTVQYALQGAGYHTAIVGKYLQGMSNQVVAPYFDCATTWLTPNYYRFKVNDEGRMHRVRRYATTYSGNRLRDCLAEFEATDRRPWYAFWAPHAPHKSADYDNMAEPERRYKNADVPPCAKRGEPNISDKPGYITNRNPPLERVRAVCENAERALMTLDDEIAKVIDWLESNRESDTLVIYWSDNGALAGQHNRIGKSVPYLPSVQVPMFLWWPGELPARTDERLATNVDLAPTILDAADVRPLSDADGHSLLGRIHRSVQYSESLDEPTVDDKMPQWFQLLNPGRWSYIENHLRSGEVFTEYYNLRADPRQHRNLLGDGTSTNDPPLKRLAALHSRLQLARSCSGTQAQLAPNPCP